MTSHHLPAFRVAVLALLLMVLSVGGEAHAGKPAASPIRTVGVDAFDSVFQEARSIDNILLSAQNDRHKARRGVNTALGLDAQTRFPDALQELRSRSPESLKVALAEGVPALQASQAPPELSSAVNAVNSAVVRYHSILQGLGHLPQECQQLASALGQLNIDRLRAELAIKTPEDALRHVGRLATYQTNITTIVGLPEKAGELIRNLREDLKAVVDTFQRR